MPSTRENDPMRTYSCDEIHFHFEPNRRKDPWYKVRKFPDEYGDFPAGTKVYVRGFSSNDRPLEIDRMVKGGFHILKKDSKIQKFWGRYGRLEDQLWIAKNLSKQLWWDPSTGPPPPYDSAGSAAEPPGYERQ